MSHSNRNLRHRISSSGLHYRGRDKRGVSRWSGSWNGGLRWAGLIFTTYGAVAGIVAIGLLLYALVTPSWPSGSNTLILLALIHAVTFGSIGAWAVAMRRRILSLSSPEQLAAQLDVPAGVLEQAALAKGIKPRMSINDVDYYNPADFAAEALTLLRGASEPAMTADVLLRAAGGSRCETYAEQLLRPDITAPAQKVQVQEIQAAHISTDRYEITAPAQTIQAGHK